MICIFNIYSVPERAGRGGALRGGARERLFLFPAITIIATIILIVIIVIVLIIIAVAVIIIVIVIVFKLIIIVYLRTYPDCRQSIITAM